MHYGFNWSAMDLNKSSSKAALILVASSFLVYTIYQSITTTIFVLHFPTVIKVLPTVIDSSNPTLQCDLFLFQEGAGSIGGYLRLAGAIIALNSAVLYARNNPIYLARFRLVVLLESLYFLLLIPAAANHLIGSLISSSAFLNFYTGVSTLLQALLIFPPLFMLSQKLKNPQNRLSTQKWACIAAPLYVFGFWVRHGLFWIYALSAMAPSQSGIFQMVGFLDSGLTLLAAGVITTFACVAFKKKSIINIQLVASAIVLVGSTSSFMTLLPFGCRLTVLFCLWRIFGW